jgi:hypothetical protein
MSKYLITFSRSARKELEALDGKLVNRIFPKIENLSVEENGHSWVHIAGTKGYTLLQS